MIDKINNLGTNPKAKQSEINHRGLKKETSEKDNTPKSVNHGDSEVNLSSEAKKLDQLKNAIMDTPEIDQAKVEKIKTAIANGDYSVNPENLAKKILESFSG